MIKSTAIILARQELIYLQYNKAKQGWECPGGKQENDETSLECASREVLEETGVETACKDMIPIGIVQHEQFLCKCYACHTFVHNPRVMEPSVHSQGSWFPIFDLPKPLAYGTEPFNLYVKEMFNVWSSR